MPMYRVLLCHILAKKIFAVPYTVAHVSHYQLPVGTFRWAVW